MSVNISSSLLWDSVAGCFQRTDQNSESYTPGKDNYETVYPILHDIINSHLTQRKHEDYRICDFGCGTGILAEQLHRMQFQTFACDCSYKMIAQACSSTMGGVTYDVGGVDFVQAHSPFDLITAIMVFQFIPDFDTTANILRSCLTKNGILFFAVHNADYAYECAKHKVKFYKLKNLSNTHSGSTGEIQIEQQRIPTYVRSPQWYDSILFSSGLERIASTYKEKVPPPGVPEEFCVQWRWPKYYIAWYKNRI